MFRKYIVYTLFFLLMLAPTRSIFMAHADANPLPSPTGPYKVGVVWRHWIDESRDEIYDSAPHEKREIMVEFLYPATPKDDAKTAPYMINQDAVAPAFDSLMEANQVTFNLLPSDLSDFKSYSFPDAPISEDQSNYPVLIFSHGAGGEVTMYTAQLEELASHGYIVVAINHPYGAAATVFPDGRTINWELRDGLDGTAPIWSKDQIFVMDQLENLNVNDPEKLFTSRLNLDQIGVFGHSLGGSTATMTCFVDKRCKAGANEDGPVFGDVIDKGLDQPFLYMITDHRIFYDPASYKNVRGPYYEVAFKGFEHLDFGDFHLWPKSETIQKALLLGSVDAQRAATVTRSYLLAFFDTYLKATPSPLLDGSSAAFPEVTVTSENVSTP